MTQTSPDTRSLLDDLYSVVYEELCRIASSVRRLSPGASVTSTALVHEAWLKFQKSPRVANTTPAHFKAIAAAAMRQVVIDHVRARRAQKRGGGAIVVSLDEAPDVAAADIGDDALLVLDAALEELGKVSPRQAAMIVERFFGGMTVSEVAQKHDVSESLVERDCRAAKAWLGTRLRSSET